jgi:hypothetical protein|uniref:Uncharacterized protein n=1 Tax=Leptospirillum ferriphilum TaxID=178606 RepID=A0A2I2MI78_9BACT
MCFFHPFVFLSVVTFLQRKETFGQGVVIPLVLNFKERILLDGPSIERVEEKIVLPTPS